MDYGRRLHYFLAIPIGWDRTYEKEFGKFEVASENEVSVGGFAYAGVFQDDGTSTGHLGANLVRTVNSVAFSFPIGENTFTVTPMEFTNDCAAFQQGVNCEWEASGTFEYENEKIGIGFGAELSHKSGLTAYSAQTQSENIFQLGYPLIQLRQASGLRKSLSASSIS